MTVFIFPKRYLDSHLRYKFCFFFLSFLPGILFSMGYLMLNFSTRKIFNINLVCFIFFPLVSRIWMLLLQYRTDFPSSMKEHAVFADLAPRFLLLAEDILQRQVHLVIYNLKEVMPLLTCMQHL